MLNHPTVGSSILSRVIAIVFFCSSRCTRVVRFLSQSQMFIFCVHMCVFDLVFLTFFKGKIDTKFLSKNHASETETRGHR